MCVICYKPKGVKVSKKTIAAIWNTNPDGAGLSYYQGGQCIIDKGIFNQDYLWEKLTNLVDVDVAFHCRIATSGITNGKQTHPFAISRNVDLAKGETLNTVAKACLFHNGVIPDYGDNDISDTLQFVTQVVAWTHPKARLQLFDFVPGKYILMQQGMFWLIGDFEKYKGLQCSNLYFKPVATRSYYAPRNWRQEKDDKPTVQELFEAQQEDQTCGYTLDKEAETLGGLPIVGYGRTMPTDYVGEFSDLFYDSNYDCWVDCSSEVVHDANNTEH